MPDSKPAEFPSENLSSEGVNHKRDHWIAEVHMRKSLVVSALVSAYGMLGVLGAAEAAELGALTVYSNVGEPFEAKLDVRDVDPRVEPLLVRLAPASVYQRVGKTAQVDTNDLTLELESKSPYVVRIKGKSAVSSQRFPLIVELSEAGRISAKLYTVELREGAPAAQKTAQTTPQTKTAAPAVNESTQVGARTAANMSTVPSASSSTVPSAVPSATGRTATTSTAGTVPSASPSANTIKVQSTTSSTSAAEAAARKRLEAVHEDNAKRESAAATAAKAAAAPAATAATKPAAKQTSGAVTLPLNPADYNLDSPFEVRQGMTMWSIAKLYKDRYPKATMDQLLVGFVRANPKAYDGGRVNGVKVGAKLRAPKASDVESIPVDDAWALVRVNPNADATKAPSRKTLERARTQMKKQAPALAAQVNARVAEEKAAVAEKAAAAKKAAEKAAAEKAAEEKAAQEKAAAAAAAAATAAASSTPAAATPAADPLAKTLESSGQGAEGVANESNTSGTASVGDSATSETASADAAPQTADTAPADAEQPATEAAIEDAEHSSSSALWVGIIIVLLVLIGGAALFLKGRNRRRRDEQALRTVRFMRAEPASAEQLKGSSQMVQNRMEADKAAARGFGSVEKKAEPSLGAHAQFEKRPAAPTSAPMPSAPAAFGQAPAAASAAQAAPAESVSDTNAAKDTAEAHPFNVASAYVAEEGAVAAPDINSVKLTNAQNWINIKAYEKAMMLLKEVELAGNPQQKTLARELIEKINAESRQ